MHLVVIQHGLWGAPGNTAYMSMKLREELKEGYYVLNSDVNVGNLTYDGIDVCGDRLHALVLATIEELRRSNKPVHAISMVGYSMGGLITRYVAGKLYAEGYFETIAPVNFVTVATPHLGAWRMPSTWYNRAFNFMVPVVTSRSGYQLVLQDKHLWGKPLLCLMSHPDLLFMRALRCFRKLMLLANVFHDRPVPYCTAAIRLDNPYELSQPVPVDSKYPSIVTPAVSAAGASKASTAAEGGKCRHRCPIVHVVSTAEGTKPAVAGAVSGPASNGDGAGAAAASGQRHAAVDAGKDADARAGSGPETRTDPQQQGPKQHDAAEPGVSAQGADLESAPAPPEQQPPPQRPLRSTYIRVLLVLFLPLAIPALLFMVITGRSHHSKIMRTAMDFSWIQRHHDQQQQQLDDTSAADSSTASNRRRQGSSGADAASPDEAVRLLVAPPDAEDRADGPGAAGSVGPGPAGASKQQQQRQRPARPLSDIECPSAPDLPAIAATSAALIAAATGGAPLSGSRSPAGTGPAGSGAEKAAASGGTAAGAGGARSGSGSGRPAAPAAASAPGALDDGDDEVVVSEQAVLLHDGIVEMPAEVHRVQEWLVEQLNRLPWHKVDVDCRDYHAHAAIVMRNPGRFQHCRDVIDYLCDHFERAQGCSSGKGACA